MNNLHTTATPETWQAFDQLPPVPGVYAIKNNVNGKIYVGSSINMESRQKHHIKSLNNNKHHSSRLQSEWNKYKSNSFTFYLCERIDDVSLLLDQEQLYIEKYNACDQGIGFNVLKYAHSPCRKRISSKKITHKESTSNKLTETDDRWFKVELLKIAMGDTFLWNEDYMDDLTKEMLLADL